MKLHLHVLCFTLLLIGGTLRAQVNGGDAILDNSGAATPVAVPFLRMNQDVRAAGMGETSVALPGSETNSLTNPARLGNAQNKYGVMAAYTPWMRNLANNIYLMSLSGFYKLSDEDEIGGGIRYFKQGELIQTDDNGVAVGSSRPYDMSVELTYARKLAKQWHIGATLRYVYSQVIGGNANFAGYKNGNALAADIGVYYQTKEKNDGGWNFGAALTNLGSKMKYSSNANENYFLPTNLGVGAAYHKKFQEEHQLTFSAELNKLLVPGVNNDGSQPGKGALAGLASGWGNKELQLGFGGEYTYHDIFSLRAGYYHESKARNGLQYFTAGVGIAFSGWKVNMAYLVPSGNTTSSNSINNTVKLGLACFIK